MKQQVTVAEAGSHTMLERYQTAVEEMEALRTECKLVEGQLEEARAGQQSQQTELQERNTELGQLQNQLTELRRAAEDESCKVEERLVEKETELLNLQQTTSEQMKTLEV